MKKTILKFGLIPGVIFTVWLLAMGFVWKSNGMQSTGWGEIIGYASMIVAFSFIFFGIRSYRQNYGNGFISFGKAFQVGILIALIASLFYVITWLFVYYTMLPDFMDQYANCMIRDLKAQGASAEKMKATMDQMQMYREWYKNPFSIALITFVEPFPLGLFITLVSAFILKKSPARN